MVDVIHTTKGARQGIALRTGAYAQTWVSFMEALAFVEPIFIEVHLAIIPIREKFYHVLNVFKQSLGLICGFEPRGHLMLTDAIIDDVKEPH